tara:strand:- start:390 stop:569 length:180 start_codon:yes stop_codon:yes gene_type:complete
MTSTALGEQGEVPFKIHLPKIVGIWILEPPIRFVLVRFLGINTAVALQDLRDGTGTRDV